MKNMKNFKNFNFYFSLTKNTDKLAANLLYSLTLLLSSVSSLMKLFERCPKLLKKIFIFIGLDFIG